MYDTLYRYLIFNKQVSLPGVGTISLQRNAARHSIADKIFTAPEYSFVIDNSNDRPSRKLFDWLSLAMGVSEWDAVRMVNDFSFKLKNDISSGSAVKWDNVGVLHRDETGNIVLDPFIIAWENEEPVVAEKVIREKAEHTMLVGERERTSTEMEVILLAETEKEKRREWGWVIAIVLVVLSVMFIGLYFSEKGLLPSSSGNQVKMQKTKTLK